MIIAPIIHVQQPFQRQFHESAMGLDGLLRIPAQLYQAMQIGTTPAIVRPSSSSLCERDPQPKLPCRQDCVRHVVCFCRSQSSQLRAHDESSLDVEELRQQLDEACGTIANLQDENDHLMGLIPELEQRIKSTEDQARQLFRGSLLRKTHQTSR